MRMRLSETKKGAASIYIVIFTTTLLGIIALSFVRVMLAESNRTTNYSLSQSAYNSALAGIEDAKIALLRYQSCVNKGSYAASSGTSKECSKYYDYFGTFDHSSTTAQDCSAVGRLLHGNSNSNTETLIQKRDNGSQNNVIDQAYTCVKVSAYTEDFLAVLKDDNPTKIIPLRAESAKKQDDINRIHLEWFDDENYQEISKDNYLLDSYTGFWRKSGTNTAISDLTGKLSSNKGEYGEGLDENSLNYGNKFTGKALAPPALQVSLVQTAENFTIEQFNASGDVGNWARTNRGTLLLRPSSNTDITTEGNTNILPQNVLAYSANKSFNTPIDVLCKPTKPGSSDSGWGNYACSADIYIPKPIGWSESNRRNMTTSFLIVNLPYGTPTTDISVKMYSCTDMTKPIGATVGSENKVNCNIVHFANVQPMVDSTGRANDLFRRVEARIELADINFPIANYALAMTDPNNSTGIEKDFYVTNGCSFSTSYVHRPEGSDRNTINTIAGECANSGKTGEASGKGNGE